MAIYGEGTPGSEVPRRAEGQREKSIRVCDLTHEENIRGLAEETVRVRFNFRGAIRALRREPSGAPLDHVCRLGRRSRYDFC